MEKIFSYGTLMFSDIQQKLFRRIILGEKDILKGYRKISINIDNEIYPAIVYDQKSEVRGFVLEVTSDELLKTDIYEGEEYLRKKVTLISGLEAWVYVVNEEKL